MIPATQRQANLQHLVSIEGCRAKFVPISRLPLPSFVGVTEREVKKVPRCAEVGVQPVFRTRPHAPARRSKSKPTTLCRSHQPECRVVRAEPGPKTADTVETCRRHAEMFVCGHGSRGAPPSRACGKPSGTSSPAATGRQAHPPQGPARNIFTIPALQANSPDCRLAIVGDVLTRGWRARITRSHSGARPTWVSSGR